MSVEKFSLVDLEGGAAVEMFDIAMQKVIENIHDINTTNKTREITLKVKIVPMHDDRSIIGYTIECPTKLCGQEPVKGIADLAIKEGKLVAFGRGKEQPGIPFSNVSEMKPKTE